MLVKNTCEGEESMFSKTVVRRYAARLYSSRVLPVVFHLYAVLPEFGFMYLWLCFVYTLTITFILGDLHVLAEGL